jgi:carboxypeptidase Taq
MSEAWDKLLGRLQELNDWGGAVALLEWDQAVLMPQEGGAARARAIATIEATHHARFTDPEIRTLIENLEPEDGLSEDQQASLRILKRDYEKATKVPDDLVRELAEARGHAYQAWTKARPADDFSILQPHLEKLIDLKLQEADALGYEDEAYDALLDQFEPGMTTAHVSRVFDQLLADLQPLATRILDRADEPPDFVSRRYDAGKQMAFCTWLVEQLHFDVSQGRLDVSPHPFTIRIGVGDVRQTTRADEDNLLMSVYAAIHETGHALYEQGIPHDLVELPVGRAPSLGMHESQSRLWENQVGRGRAFTSFMLPHLKDRFPEELGMLTPEDFYRGVNHAERTLIRVTADELTYNLHVALRFELELALFRGQAEVKDLPEIWDDAMERHVGIRPPNRSDGVLQDMHWSIGMFGYFPTYTLGTIYSAAFFEAAQKELGSLDDELRAGKTDRLLNWLRRHIHHQGYRRDAADLAEDITGKEVSPRPLLDYLEAKYTALYPDNADNTSR